ncbi:MAG: glycosyltransferase family 2 protein [Rikenellaceae bacterium]
MTILLHILDILLFVIIAVNILYLTFFSIASLLRFKERAPLTATPKRIAILIPAYKEDKVIRECVKSCLKQNYSPTDYDVVVISDRMSDTTNLALEKLPIKLIRVSFENSTKAKALNYAFSQLDDIYDLALILDADNIIQHDFLSQLSSLFAYSDIKIVQAHRCAKNINTPPAMLDAISEEINNSIFRRGHARVGLSAALIGSGMCFNYKLLKQTMLMVDAVGGFDRALELLLLRNGTRVFYLPYSDVLDEKIQHHSDFSNQRRRWLSAQLHYLSTTIKYVPAAIAERKWDFCDKMFQQMSIPRIMLLGFCFIFSIIVTFIDFSMSIKWWSIFAILIITLAIAVPRKLYTKQLFGAIVQLPYFFILMALNIFKLKGANKKFIHTKHGVE